MLPYFWKESLSFEKDIVVSSVFKLRVKFMKKLWLVEMSLFTVVIEYVARDCRNKDFDVIKRIGYTNYEFGEVF